MAKKTARKRVLGSGSKVHLLGTFAHRNKVYLYYRKESNPKHIFHLAESDDGFSFVKNEKDLYIEKGKEDREDLTVCRDFTISEEGDHFLLMYIRGDNKESTGIGLRQVLEKAWSNDLLNFSYEGNMIGPAARSVLVSDSSSGKHLLYSTGMTIEMYESLDLINWEKITEDKSINIQAKDLTIGGVFKSEKGIIVIYHAKENDSCFVGLLLYDISTPIRILWKSQIPLWTQPREWGSKTHPAGVVLFDNKIIGYHETDDGIFAAIYALYKISDGYDSKDLSLRLTKVRENPIISPNPQNAWEAFNTFNPAAIYDGGKFHILYRAQGYNYVSALGYATSLDGVRIDERFSEPIYVPSEPFEFVGEKKNVLSYSYMSAGYGGCEDPRITKIEDRYFLTYVAFDGVNPPRIALTSIKASHFLTRRWLWEKPVLISPPGVVDKSAVLFPEKIKGKYVIMHRIYPDILIDFVDDLSFDGTHWLEGKYKISPREKSWDSRKIGAGAPPIKTQDGWLLIYQAVGEQDSGRYKVGAMLLDLDDPTIVLHRSRSPILEPDESYENEGFKGGVVYPCGAVVVRDTLYVYYGAADSYVCVATASLPDFLDELKFSEVARLNTPILGRIL